MRFSVQDYIDLKSDNLPYTTPWGFTLEDTEGYCPRCKRKLTNMKQLINEYDTFVMIRPVGLCHYCNLVISTYPIKVTDQDEFFFLKGGQWYQTEESWMEKVMKWVSGRIHKEGPDLR